MQTQNQYILSVLKERADKGLNSFERVNGGIYATQLPRCINDLRKQGHTILSRQEKDKSVTYYYQEPVTKLHGATSAAGSPADPKNPNKGRTIKYWNGSVLEQVTIGV